jgi:hypothetical protein
MREGVGFSDEISLSIHYFSFEKYIYLIWKKLFFENFNISENNIISVKLAKVLGYVLDEISIC